MSIEIETKHFLDNLFCLKSNDELYIYLMNHAKLGMHIHDYIVLGNKLVSSNSTYDLNDHEESLIEQLDAYNQFCYDNEIGMNELFYCLSCTKQEFDKFKAPTTTE